MEDKQVVVIGLGEVGKPLLEIVKGVYSNVVGYDKQQKFFERSLADFDGRADVLHICFPYYQGFRTAVVDYVKLLQPELLIIESTVPPGTTNAIWSMIHGDEGMTGTFIVHSPVRGRVADGFKWCLLNYTKFVGGINRDSTCAAIEYYESLGMKVWPCKSPYESEFAKILNLSYFGVMLGWNQEMRRIAKSFKLEISDIHEFFKTNNEESRFRFPRPIFDGMPIGGHCVLPAMKMLFERYSSKFIDAVFDSDEFRRKEKDTEVLQSD